MTITHANSLSRQLAPWRDILGIPVADWTLDEALAFIDLRLDARVYTPLAFLNANNANIAMQNDGFAEALDRFLILSDGIGVDLASWILHGSMFKANLNGTDFIPALLRHQRKRRKIGMIGARSDVIEAAAAAFAAEFPQHEFRIISDGFFKPEAEPAITEQVLNWQPDIVLVAMGVPRQEAFTLRALVEGSCTMPIAVGALFDLYTGSVPRAPEWMRRTRTEWIYRLWREPKRLWRRYVMGNPLFLWRTIRCRLGGKSKAGGPLHTAPAARKS